ncbi:hypothetical protein [Streptomyces anulatus]|uniref:hypothetical protein n=1 Tax=Streptomyces anulatus TaxID=1892 RepID=UPI002E11C420|nr:hypothetical protein OG557_38910 [Streptomyces anulatus]
MTTLTASQRGDMVEDMLPIAANLAVLVHGDGGPEDVGAVLAGLDEAQRTALIVVLAGLVDPDQPMGRALGWLDQDEHGALAVPHWENRTPIRDLVPEPAVDDDYVDMVAVHQYLKGTRVDLSDTEFLMVLEHAEEQGLSLPELDRRQGATSAVNGDRVNRMRKAYQRSGRALPPVLVAGDKQPEFTDAQVVEIRERYAAGGVTDLELSLMYGRSRKAISSLLSGASYRAAGGPIRAPRGAKPKEASRTEFAGHTGPAPVLDVARAS